MVRLVFRPYTQVRRTICTSVSLRASTRVSSGLALLRHSSPSFGSQQACSHSNLSQKIAVGGRCTPLGDPAAQFSCASWAWHPPARTHVRLLGPCFKTGRMQDFRQRPERAGTPKGPPRRAHARDPRPPRRRVVGVSIGPHPPSAAEDHAGKRPVSNRGGDEKDRRRPLDRSTKVPCIRFPLGNFKHSLTLFSKFFSSFPRGTCSLSVPRQYLALDGIYHPIGAAFPSNPTRRQRLVAQQGPRTDGAVTLFGIPFQGTWARPAAEVASKDYNSRSKAPGFSIWALPASLAATGGILVGFSSSA
jgi:hypothetical protein